MNNIIINVDEMTETEPELKICIYVADNEDTTITGHDDVPVCWCGELGVGGSGLAILSGGHRLVWADNGIAVPPPPDPLLTPTTPFECTFP